MKLHNLQKHPSELLCFENSKKYQEKHLQSKRKFLGITIDNRLRLVFSRIFYFLENLGNIKEKRVFGFDFLFFSRRLTEEIRLF